MQFAGDTMPNKNLPTFSLPGPVAGLPGGRGGTWQPSSEERSRTVGLISLMVDEYCRGKSRSVFHYSALLGQINNVTATMPV